MHCYSLKMVLKTMWSTVFALLKHLFLWLFFPFEDLISIFLLNLVTRAEENVFAPFTTGCIKVLPVGIDHGNSGNTHSIHFPSFSCRVWWWWWWWWGIVQFGERVGGRGTPALRTVNLARFMLPFPEVKLVLVFLRDLFVIVWFYPLSLCWGKMKTSDFPSALPEQHLCPCAVRGHSSPRETSMEAGSLLVKSVLQIMVK